jgi:hypothetical protein
VDVSQLAAGAADLDEDEQQQPAPKRMRPGAEPGKLRLINKRFDYEPPYNYTVCVVKIYIYIIVVSYSYFATDPLRKPNANNFIV